LRLGKLCKRKPRPILLHLQDNIVMPWHSTSDKRTCTHLFATVAFLCLTVHSLDPWLFHGLQPLLSLLCLGTLLQ
jgi:hypothetical protein